MDERGLARHRLNACGYSLGARFSPSWMEHQMFHIGNPQEIEPDMSLFVHMIIMDSDSGTAMTLGQTYLTTTDTPRAAFALRAGLHFCLGKSAYDLRPKWQTTGDDLHRNLRADSECGTDGLTAMRKLSTARSQALALPQRLAGLQQRPTR